MDRLDRPVLRIRFATADQGDIDIELKLADVDVEGGHPVERCLRGGPPDWLEDPLRSWPDPQGPITFTGTVTAGREAEARAALGLADG